jgi:hypothetical protein
MLNDAVWTLDGDEASWAEWASARAEATAWPRVRALIAAHSTAAQTPVLAWALDLGCGTGRAFGPLAAALDEVRRVLHPGVRAVLHFLDVDDWRSTLAPRIEAAEAPVPSYRAVVTAFASRQTIQRWIVSSGLELLSLELGTSPSQAGEQRDWIATCRTQGRKELS